MKANQTRPSVGYAKDWLDQLFLVPDLVWKKSFGFDRLDAVKNIFFISEEAN